MNAALLAAAVISSVVYAAGGSLVLWSRRLTGQGTMALTSLSAGLLLAIAILDLIPETSESLPSGSLFVMLGFLLMYLIHLLSASVAGKSQEEPAGRRLPMFRDGTAAGVSVGMLLHNLVEGAAIGFSYEVGASFGLMVSLALIVHKIPEGLSYSSIMLAVFGRRRTVALLLAVQGLCVWIGLLFSLLAGERGPHEQWLAGALAVTAGLFLYVGGTSLLPAVQRQRGKLLPALFVGGIMLYFLLHGTAEALG